MAGSACAPCPSAEGAPGSTVLVAVNGKIAGESKLFPERPGEPAAKFVVIAPDSLFKPVTLSGD